jgi:hypothetical protein
MGWTNRKRSFCNHPSQRRWVPAGPLRDFHSDYTLRVFIVPLESDAELAGAVLRVMERSPEERAVMGRAAREQMRASFDIGVRYRVAPQVRRVAFVMPPNAFVSTPS